MFREQRNKVGLHFKKILMNRRRSNYEDRQRLSVSILSLLPEKIDKHFHPMKGMQNRLPQRKGSKDICNSPDTSSQRKTFVKSFIYKKSSQKQKSIFDKLKINNLAGIRNFGHIIFNLNVDEIMERIEKKALQNQNLSVGHGKQFACCKPSFKLSDSCKISHMHLNAQARFAKQEKMPPASTSTQKSKSSFICRNKPKSTSLNSTIQHSLHKDKPKFHKKQEIKGWQWQAPKRFMTSYEDDLQDFN